MVRIVALSGLAESDAALEALRAGASGFLPKTASPEALVRPLLAVLDGWSVIPEPLLRQLLDDAAPSADQGIAAQLSADDRRLWRLVAEGTSTIDIATTLHVSERNGEAPGGQPAAPAPGLHPGGGRRARRPGRPRPERHGALTGPGRRGGRASRATYPARRRALPDRAVP